MCHAKPFEEEKKMISTLIVNMMFSWYFVWIWEQFLFCIDKIDLFHWPIDKSNHLKSLSPMDPDEESYASKNDSDLTKEPLESNHDDHAHKSKLIRSYLCKVHLIQKLSESLRSVNLHSMILNIENSRKLPELLLQRIESYRTSDAQ